MKQLNENLYIRKGREQDVGNIHALYNSIILEQGCTADLTPKTYNERMMWFKSHATSPLSVYVIEWNHNFIGYMYFSNWRGGREAVSKVVEVSFFIKKEYRGLQIGNHCLSWGIQQMKKNGFKFAIAILLDQNIPSKKLLAKHQFKIVGHIPKIADLGNKIVGQYIMMREL